MRTSIRLLTIQLIMLTAACSLLPEDEKGFQSSTQSTDYMKVQNIKALEVPEPLSTPRFVDLYPVPEAAKNLEPSTVGKKFKLTQPKPLEIIWDDQKVQLRKKGARQWIRLNAKPGQVWSVLHQYLKAKALSVDNEDSRTGTIESVWMNSGNGVVLFDAVTPTENAYRKLRVRIERGSDADISNIYLSVVEHSSASRAHLPSSNNIDWTNSEALLPQVTRLLSDLHQFLVAQDYSKANISLAGQSISSDPMAEITWVDGKPALKLRQDFNYGWKQVGQALKTGKFPVEDLNRSEGTFFIRLADKDGKENSFYKHLRKDAKLDQELLGSGLLYIKVNSVGRLTSVSLSAEKGVALSPGLQQAFLAGVKENLE